MTLTYAASGLAVNHRADWDYNRARRTTRLEIGGPAALLPRLEPTRRATLERDPVSLTDREVVLLAEALGRKLEMSVPPQNTFWRSRHQLVVYFSAGEAEQVEYDVQSGALVHTQRHERPFLRQLNFLHLNEAGHWWTYVADAYATALLFLAITGVVVVRGRHGLRGRGGVLAGVGVLVPLAAILWFRLG